MAPSFNVIYPSTPRLEAYAILLDQIAACRADCENRIIFEMSNHNVIETYAYKSGRTWTHRHDGYLMVDFSLDFGEHPIDDGSCLVSSDFRDTKDADNVCFRIRNIRNLYLFLCSLIDHGKLKECYVEGY